MHDLSLHILDLVQNSIQAKAGRIEVLLEARPKADRLLLEITDDGQGMDPEFLAAATDPFVTTRTTRAVGLGLPLLKELCEQTGGDLKLESSRGRGTLLSASMGLDHWDRLPLGSLSETFATLTMGHPDLDFRLVLRCQEEEYDLDWKAMRDQLQDVPLNEPAVLDFIKTNIARQQVIIFGGVLHEINRRTRGNSQES